MNLPPDNCRTYRHRSALTPGRRVKMNWQGRTYEGVVCGDVHIVRDDEQLAYVPVQIEPAGSHYIAYDVAPNGNCRGWTDKEYRIARESAESRERARSVEEERREKYPDAHFSAYRTRIRRDGVVHDCDPSGDGPCYC